MRPLDFVFEALPMEFASSGISGQRFAKLVDGRPLMLDLLWVTPKLQVVWDDRQRVAWNEGTLTVVSRDGLITLNLTAGRAQDLVDIQSLAAPDGAGVDCRDEAAAGVPARVRAALTLDAMPHGGIDMSPAAVTARLQDAAAMSSLCLELVPAGKTTDPSH